MTLQVVDGHNVKRQGYGAYVLGLGLDLPEFCFMNVQGSEERSLHTRSLCNIKEAFVSCFLAPNG